MQLLSPLEHLRHVKEGEVVLLLDDFGDLLPLLLSWIDAGRVVGAGMKKDWRERQ